MKALLILGIIILVVSPFFGLGGPELIVWLLILCGVIYLAVRTLRDRKRVRV